MLYLSGLEIWEVPQLPSSIYVVALVPLLLLPISIRPLSHPQKSEPYPPRSFGHNYCRAPPYRWHWSYLQRWKVWWISTSRMWKCLHQTGPLEEEASYHQGPQSGWKVAPMVLVFWSLWVVMVFLPVHKLHRWSQHCTSYHSRIPYI